MSFVHSIEEVEYIGEHEWNHGSVIGIHLEIFTRVAPRLQPVAENATPVHAGRVGSFGDELPPDAPSGGLGSPAREQASARSKNASVPTAFASNPSERSFHRGGAERHRQRELR